MTRQTDDETLMAYADGVLSHEHISLVEALLRVDTEARRCVAMFRATAMVVRLAFEEPMWSDPPSRLLHTLQTGRGPSQNFRRGTQGTPFTPSGLLAKLVAMLRLSSTDNARCRALPPATAHHCHCQFQPESRKR